MRLFITILLLFSLPAGSSFVLAATPFGTGSGDSLQPEKVHSPKLAASLSAMLPGAGQVYNKKYWKVPVLYSGLGLLYYLVRFNNNLYVDYRNAYRVRVDGDPATIDYKYDEHYQQDRTKQFTDEELVILKEYYRRNRDLSYIIAGIVYLLNIVDATVDAHLYSFDVSDKLSFNLSPILYRGFPSGTAPGMALSLRF